MTDYDIAKLFKELGGRTAPRGTEAIRADGTTTNTGENAYYPPTEQECRELMESLLPERCGWKLKWYSGLHYWAVYFSKSINNQMTSAKGDSPSEAYLLAAKWLKDQAAPKFKVGDLVVTCVGVLGSVRNHVGEHFEIKTGIPPHTLVHPRELIPLDEAIAKLKEQV